MMYCRCKESAINHKGIGDIHRSQSLVTTGCRVAVWAGSIICNAFLLGPGTSLCLKTPYIVGSRLNLWLRQWPPHAEYPPRAQPRLTILSLCVQADLTCLSSGHARVVDSPVGLFLGGHKRQQTILPTSPASIPASMLFSCTLATKVAKEWQVFDFMCPLLLDISA